MSKSLPVKGEKHWRSKLDGWLLQLGPADSGGGFYNGNTASRPTGLTAEDSGKIYIDTETNNLLQWDGTAWQVMIEGYKETGLNFVSCTSNRLILMAECDGMYVFNNDEASQTITFTLQYAQAGYNVTIINNAKQTIRIKTLFAGDEIYTKRVRNGAGYTEISQSSKGAIINLYCTADQKWIASDNEYDEIKKITAADAEASDYFGISSAISSDGSTVVVGAYQEDSGSSDGGAGYIYSKSSDWGEVKKLIASDIQAFDYFGYSVSISENGNLVAIGAYFEDTGGSVAGSVYIFGKDEGGVDNWGEIKKIQSGDIQAGDQFGYRVTVSEDGQYIIVGANSEDTTESNAGSVYVFGKDEGGVDNWGEMKKIQASDPQVNGYFGSSLSISADNNKLIAGAYGADSGSVVGGAVYIFGKDEGGINNWGEIKKIVSTDIQADDRFGFSLSISGNGDIIAAGSYTEDTGNSDAGAVYVFGKDEGGVDNWGQVKKIQAEETEIEAYFGRSLSLSKNGNILIVGSHFKDEEYSDSGVAYIFESGRGGINNWEQIKKIQTTDASGSDYFGRSVSLTYDGNTALVGADSDDTTATDTGSVYLFER